MCHVANFNDCTSPYPPMYYMTNCWKASTLGYMNPIHIYIYEHLLTQRKGNNSKFTVQFLFCSPHPTTFWQYQIILKDNWKKPSSTWYGYPLPTITLPSFVTYSHIASGYSQSQYCPIPPSKYPITDHGSSGVVITSVPSDPNSLRNSHIWAIGQPIEFIDLHSGTNLWPDSKCASDHCLTGNKYPSSWFLSHRRCQETHHQGSQCRVSHSCFPQCSKFNPSPCCQAPPHHGVPTTMLNHFLGETWIKLFLWPPPTSKIPIQTNQIEFKLIRKDESLPFFNHLMNMSFCPL